MKPRESLVKEVTRASADLVVTVRVYERESS